MHTLGPGGLIRVTAPHTPLALVVTYGSMCHTRLWPWWSDMAIVWGSRGRGPTGGGRVVTVETERGSLCLPVAGARPLVGPGPLVHRPMGGMEGSRGVPGGFLGVRGFWGVASEVPLTGPLSESCSLRRPGPRCLVHTLSSLRLPAGSLRGFFHVGNPADLRRAADYLYSPPKTYLRGLH
jgi:hypothetical protein